MLLDDAALRREQLFSAAQTLAAKMERRYTETLRGSIRRWWRACLLQRDLEELRLSVVADRDGADASRLLHSKVAGTIDHGEACATCDSQGAPCRSPNHDRKLGSKRAKNDLWSPEQEPSPAPATRGVSVAELGEEALTCQCEDLTEVELCLDDPPLGSSSAAATASHGVGEAADGVVRRLLSELEAAETAQREADAKAAAALAAAAARESLASEEEIAATLACESLREELRERSAATIPEDAAKTATAHNAGKSELCNEYSNADENDHDAGEEEDHLALAFELRLEDHTLDSFPQEKREDFRRHVAERLGCDAVRIHSLREGSVIVEAHAVGFVHEGHALNALEKIRSGQAVHADTWGPHGVSSHPQLTSQRHRASARLRGQRTMHAEVEAAASIVAEEARVEAKTEAARPLLEELRAAEERIHAAARAEAVSEAHAHAEAAIAAERLSEEEHAAELGVARGFERGLAEAKAGAAQKKAKPEVEEAATAAKVHDHNARQKCCNIA
eukprot:TRINITY_DN25096_c0_g4_i1.p1 TRINITY_DN25096_c0_g4~~TRINITY_DN25096_c0_g4_i1.p1  ORF type:complete len:506 (+),score=124.58 TRINITY_DN25096_c0_g4_i1:171-1688(+)